MFIPAAGVGLAYFTRALQRVHGGPWWAALTRAIGLAALGFAVLTAVLRAGMGG